MPEAKRKTHERAADRVLVEVGARDLSDAQHALLARIRSAGDSAGWAIESAASEITAAVDEALGSIGLNVEAPRLEGWREGVLYVIRELDDHALVDVFAGASPIEKALRALQREAETRETPT